VSVTDARAELAARWNAPSLRRAAAVERWQVDPSAIPPPRMQYLTALELVRAMAGSDYWRRRQPSRYKRPS
jgi:hypothetical protein